LHIFLCVKLYSDPFGSGSESERFDRIRILQNIRILSDSDSDPQHCSFCNMSFIFVIVHLDPLCSGSKSRQIIWIWIWLQLNVSILLDFDWGSFGSTTRHFTEANNNNSDLHDALFNEYKKTHSL